jgi:hypothetical protein
MTEKATAGEAKEPDGDKTWDDYRAKDSHLIWGAFYKHLGKHSGNFAFPPKEADGTIPWAYLNAKCMSCFRERILGEMFCLGHLTPAHVQAQEDVKEAIRAKADAEALVQKANEALAEAYAKLASFEPKKT